MRLGAATSVDARLAALSLLNLTRGSTLPPVGSDLRLSSAEITSTKKRAMP
jgi:hypothetical protein